MEMKLFRKALHVFLFPAVVLTAYSCSQEKSEDLTQSVNKDGSIETSVTVEPVDSLHDVLVTKHIVWNHNQAWKTIEQRDTIPALGLEPKQSENEVGVGRKDYEIYITVK